MQSTPLPWRLGPAFRAESLTKSYPTPAGAETAPLRLLCRGEGWSASVTAAREGLERLGVGPLADRRPHAMSIGQQQRIAVARALAGPAGVILADEPTGALDAASAEAV